MEFNEEFTVLCGRCKLIWIVNIVPPAFKIHEMEDGLSKSMEENGWT